MTEFNALELTREIARYLDGWTATPPSRDDLKNRAYLSHRCGWQLYLIEGGSDGFCRDKRRIKISGQHRREWHGLIRPATPRITVAKNRGPATIAREITRRLLPDYKKFYDNLQAAQQQREADRAEEISALNLIAETAHGRIPDPQHLHANNYGSGGASVHFGRYNEHSWPHGRVERFYNGRMDMHLDDLLPGEAAAVLECLIDLRK